MNSGVRSQRSEGNGFGQFERDGFQIVKAVLTDAECDLFSAELTPLFEQQQKSAKGKVGGVRNLLRVSLRISQMATSIKLVSLLESVTGFRMFPVRAIFFDKNPDANWLVPWHQDLAITVAERVETPGYSGWSIKDKTWHVHPPQEILENMATVRLHLDDCDVSNGALKVLPETHRYGKLGAADIARWSAKIVPVICELSKGDAQLMRPLLLHASSPADNPRHRRVLHIEYASHDLPNGLKWFERE